MVGHPGWHINLVCPVRISCGKLLLLLRGFDGPEATVGKLHKQRLLHVFLHESALVFGLVYSDKQLSEVRVEENAPELF